MGTIKNKKVFLKTDKVIYKLSEWLGNLSVVSLLAMGFLATVDVISSKCFNMAIPLTNDIIKYFMVPTCCCLLASVQFNGGLMQVDLISRKYSMKSKKIFTIIYSILGIGIFGFIGWRSAALTIKYYTTHELSSMSASAFPIWPMAFVCTVGFFSLMFAFVWTIVRCVFITQDRNMMQ